MVHFTRLSNSGVRVYSAKANRCPFGFRTESTCVAMLLFVSVLSSPVPAMAQKASPAAPKTSDIPNECISNIPDQLSPAEVIATVQVPVDSVHEAMTRLAAELQPGVKRDKLLLLFLIDRSESCADQTRELKDAIPAFVEKLQATTAKTDPSVTTNTTRDILFDVLGYDGKHTSGLKQPVRTVEEITTAISHLEPIPATHSYLLAALEESLQRLNQTPELRNRQPILIILTDQSAQDDSPDSDALEKTIHLLHRHRARVYFLGQEASAGISTKIYFGTQRDSEIRWKTCGPESAISEMLPCDLLVNSNVFRPSGFGPYCELRLAWKTDGCFYLLPSNDPLVQQIKAYHEIRRERCKIMGSYAPELVSRQEYLAMLKRSPFRRAYYQSIVRLAEYYPNKLAGRSFPFPAKQFQAEWEQQAPQLTKLYQAVSDSIRTLKEVEHLKNEEPSPRWRALHDVFYAELLLTRVRLFDLFAAAEEMPQRIRTCKKSYDGWLVDHSLDDQPFNATVALRLKVTEEEITSQRELAVMKQTDVARRYAQTAWGKAARESLELGTSARFVPRLTLNLRDQR